MAGSKNVLAEKLGHFAPLSERDIAFVEKLGSTAEDFPPGAVIVAEGEVPRTVFVVLHGLACRYRILENGRRQILTFMLPGDLCDLHVFILKAMDHSIGTLTQTKLAAIETERVLEIVYRHPRISAALWWSMLQE